MTDLSRAYQEVKSLPDEVLARELEQPSGMVPGYLIMAELEDRKAIRSSTPSQTKKVSMKDELLQGIGSIQGYAGGGLVYQTNPYYYNMMARTNPEVAASMMQEQMMQANGGYFPLNPPSALQVPGAPQPVGMPTAPNAPASPFERIPGYAAGGKVERPEERVPSGMSTPGTMVKVDGMVRPIPEMNSELMRRDLQGWKLLHGFTDYELVNPPPATNPAMATQDNGFMVDGAISPGPMLPERPKRQALSEALMGIGSIRR